MKLPSRMQNALRNLFRKQQVEAQLEDEVRAYVDMVADERMAAGMSASEARRTALSEIGGVEQVKQAVRDRRAGTGVDLLWQDARYGLRQLLRNRAFTLAAVATLGLGIGATTAMFSVVYSLLLRPLPYPDATRLMYVSSTVPAGRLMPSLMMSPDFVAVQSTTQSFEQLAAYDYTIGNLTGAGDAVRVTRVGVTANFLPMLGVLPQLGRVFTHEEDAPHGPPVILLSDHFWRSQFHADPRVLGKAIDVGGNTQTIIGVLPRHFSFPSLALEPDVYAPADLDRDTNLSVEKPVLGMTVMGRLKAGVSMRQAQAELQAIFVTRAKGYPAMMSNAVAGRQMLVEPLQRHIVGDNRKLLSILLGCVVAVLLIACANVASLQLGRAVSRRHETAVRGALGASRLRLVRQMLVESALLATLSATVGLAIAFVVTTTIRNAGLLDELQSRSAQRLRLPTGKLSAAIHMDGWVLAFMAGLTLLTTLLFGLAPALSGSRTDLRAGLRNAALQLSAGREQRLLRQALLLVEVALAVVLLTSAGLLVRSFVNVMHDDSGFDPGGTLTGVTLLNDSSTPAQVRCFVDALLPRLRSLPGVASVAVTSALPLEAADGIPLAFGRNPRPPISTWQNVPKISVTPDYFRTFGITLFSGRAFLAADNENAAHVAIVNRAFAKRFFSGDATGRQFQSNLWNAPYGFSPVTIVGVAGDVRQGGLEQTSKPVLFLPEAQAPDGEINIAMRASGDPDLLAAAMRKAVLAVDAKQPVFDVQSMEERVSGAVAPRRLVMLLTACFALLAVMLAAVGVYGVFAYSVSQRQHEMAIRLALGATRRGLLRLVLLQAARIVSVGGVLGILAALTLSRLLSSLLVGVTAHDTVSFALAWGVMTLVALLASTLPAAAAARTDLLSVLHSE